MAFLSSDTTGEELEYLALRMRGGRARAKRELRARTERPAGGSVTKHTETSMYTTKNLGELPLRSI